MPSPQQLAFDLFDLLGAVEAQPSAVAPVPISAHTTRVEKPEPPRATTEELVTSGAIGKVWCDHDDDGAHGRNHGHAAESVRLCSEHERIAEGVSPSGAEWRRCFTCAEHAAPVTPAAPAVEPVVRYPLPALAFEVGEDGARVWAEPWAAGPATFCDRCGEPDAVDGLHPWLLGVAPPQGLKQWMSDHVARHAVTDIRPHDDEAITCDSCGFPNADGSACECPDTLDPGVQVLYHLISERRPGVPWQVYTDHGVCWECLADHLHPDAWNGYSQEDIPEEVGAEIGRWTSDQPMKCWLCFSRMNPDGSTLPEPITCSACGSRWGCPDLCTRFVERWAAVSSPTTEDAAREFATLTRLRSVEGLHIYRLIAFAESEAEALKVAKVECSNGGSSWPATHGRQSGSVYGTAKGIKYEVAGYTGLVTYREVVEYVRAEARQQRLLGVSA